MTQDSYDGVVPGEDDAHSEEQEKRGLVYDLLHSIEEAEARGLEPIFKNHRAGPVSRNGPRREWFVGPYAA